MPPTVARTAAPSENAPSSPTPTANGTDVAPHDGLSGSLPDYRHSGKLTTATVLIASLLAGCESPGRVKHDNTRPINRNNAVLPTVPSRDPEQRRLDNESFQASQLAKDRGVSSGMYINSRGNPSHFAISGGGEISTSSDGKSIWLSTILHKGTMVTIDMGKYESWTKRVMKELGDSPSSLIVTLDGEVQDPVTGRLLKNVEAFDFRSAHTSHFRGAEILRYDSIATMPEALRKRANEMYGGNLTFTRR